MSCMHVVIIEWKVLIFNTDACMACHLISRLKSFLDDQQKTLSNRQLELRAIRQAPLRVHVS